MPIANPFSRFLRERLQSVAGLSASSSDGLVPAAEAFARFWDEAETLVIQIYKSGKTRREDRSDWRTMRAAFPEVYAPVEIALAAHWPSTKAGGEPVVEDPFRRLLRPESAAAIVGDWSAMQHLPAARESLNALLLDLAQGTQSDTAP